MSTSTHPWRLRPASRSSLEHSPPILGSAETRRNRIRTGTAEAQRLCQGRRQGITTFVTTIPPSFTDLRPCDGREALLKAPGSMEAHDKDPRARPHNSGRELTQDLATAVWALEICRAKQGCDRVFGQLPVQPAGYALLRRDQADPHDPIGGSSTLDRRVAAVCPRASAHGSYSRRFAQQLSGLSLT
jgi:hypothetical protein